MKKSSSFTPIDKDISKSKKIKTKKYVFKRWWFGLGKEFKRFTYKSKVEILLDFLVILLVCLIIGVILFGLDMLMVKLH